MGMASILVAGLALIVGGSLLVWKTNAFDISRFCENTGLDGRVATDLIYILHLPWLAGAWTTGTAKKYFFRKKQPDLNGCQFQATMQNAPPLDLGSRPTGGRMAGVDGRCFSPRNVIC